MTLIASLRTADGIVIAGDSLSTMRRSVPVSGDVDVTCPQCGHRHVKEEHEVGTIQVPASTFSFEQKIFPFLDKFGVGTYGTARIGDRTPYFAVRQLEQKIEDGNETIESASEAAEKIADHGQAQLEAQYRENWDQIPDSWRPLGFQVVGYEEGEAVTVTVSIGKTTKTAKYSGFGCTKSGTGRAVEAIWRSYDQHPQDQAAYAAFSLQDAIDYAKFLITTEASYQRFSSRIADVGGDVDVGLVTPYEDFTWIEQKELGRILGGDQAPKTTEGSQ